MSSRIQESDQLWRVATGSSVIFVATGFGLGLNFLYSILLARVLGVTEYGIFALGLAIFNLLSVLSLGGLDRATLKFIPQVRAQAGRSSISATLRKLLVLSSVLGGMAGASLFGATMLFGERLFHEPKLEPILLIFSVGIPAFTVSSILVASLQAFHDIVWRTTIKYVCEPISKILLTALLLWGGWSVIGAAGATVLALCLSAGLAAFPLHGYLTRTPIGSNGDVSWGGLVRFSTPVLLSLVFAGIANRSDVLILGYWESADRVAVYSAAFQTSSILILILGTLESIANPLLSQSVALGDRPQLDRLYKTVLRWSLLLALPLFMLMGLFSRELLAVFGPAFETGATCLTVLALGQIVNATIASTHNVLILTGHTRQVMWHSLTVGTVQIGLNAWLIPHYGMLGASWGTASSLILLSIVRVTQSHFLLRLHPFEWSICKPLAAAGATSVMIVMGKLWVPSVGVPGLAAMLIVFYVGFLVLLGLNVDDQVILGRMQTKLRNYAGLTTK